MSKANVAIDESNWQEHEPPFTGTCPHCGYSDKTGRCEVQGCHMPVEYEGWYRVIDGFGISTGLIQRHRVCEIHKTMLIGGQK